MASDIDNLGGLELNEEFESFDDTTKIKKIDEDFIYDDEPERECKYWLGSYARSRVMSNQNYILIFTGGTGSGKSYNAMEMALDLDPSFTADRIVFKPLDFVAVAKTKLKKGSVIMWDEVGVGLSAREWFSIQNRMISYVLETFRRDNLILIMTTPNISFIDKKVRSLLHGYCETIEKTFTGNKFGYVKYFHIVVSLREGKMMYRYPRIRDAYGRTRIVKGRSSMSGNMRFAKPPDWLTESYEEKKFDFTESLKVEAFELMSGTKEDTTKIDIGKLIDIFMEDPNKYGLLDKDESISNIINTAYVELKLRYPEKKFTKSDVDSSIKYSIKRGFKKPISMDRQKTVLLNDSMFNTIKKSHDKHKNYKKVAETLQLDTITVKKSIADWKIRGLWDDTESND